MPIFKPSAMSPQTEVPFVAAPDQQTGIRQSGSAIRAGLGAVAHLAGTVKQVADNRDRTDMQYARSETSLATNRTNFALQNAQSPEEIADALSSFNRKMDAWGDGKNEVSGTRNLRSSGSRDEYKTKYLPQIKQQMTLSGEMATVRVNRNDSIAKNNTILADTIDNASTDSSVILGYEVINNAVDSLAENNALPQNETAASYKEKQKSKLEESRYLNNINQVINMDNLPVKAAEDWISRIKDGVEHSSDYLSRGQQDHLLASARSALSAVKSTESRRQAEAKSERAAYLGALKQDATSVGLDANPAGVEKYVTKIKADRTLLPTERAKLISTANNTAKAMAEALRVKDNPARVAELEAKLHSKTLEYDGYATLILDSIKQKLISKATATRLSQEYQDERFSQVSGVTDMLASYKVGEEGEIGTLQIILPDSGESKEVEATPEQFLNLNKILRSVFERNPNATTQDILTEFTPVLNELAEADSVKEVSDILNIRASGGGVPLAIPATPKDPLPSPEQTRAMKMSDEEIKEALKRMRIDFSAK